MSLMNIQHLSYSYGKKTVLTDISFDISKGESFGIIGPNGSGKSTLLRAISGVTSDIKGNVYFKEKSILNYRKKELAKQFAYVDQEGFPTLNFTVEEIVAMGRYPWQKPFQGLSELDHDKIEQALNTLGIIELKEKTVNTLSGGEKQLVSIARAMAQEPKVLFLDEPTNYLDISHQQVLMKHIEKWRKEKKLTVVIVLHDLNLAAQYSDRLLMLHHGKVHKIGRVTDVIEESNLEKVYNTKTILIEHPVNKAPQILLHG